MERRVFLLSAFRHLKNQPDEKIYYEQVERFGIPDCFLKRWRIVRGKRLLSGEHLLPVCVEALLARIVSMSDTTGAGFHSTSTDTITGILLYLNRHMKENITLDQLSERFFPQQAPYE